MSGRWRVERWPTQLGAYRWVAYQPGHRYLELHGPSCDCYPFHTWRAAIDYADRMARTP